MRASIPAGVSPPAFAQFCPNFRANRYKGDEIIMRKMTLAFPALGLIMTLLLSLPAAANTISLSLAKPVQAAVPGAILSFIATVSAPVTNTGAVFLNGDSATVDYPLTLDDSGFLFYFPLNLAPGGSYTGTLFTVNLPTFAAVGVTYNGYFEI